METIESRLAGLGLVLPQSPQPLASYVPYVRWNRLVMIAGQLPMREGRLVVQGRVPDEIDLDTAASAARQCVLNALAILKNAVEGDWERVERILRVAVYVRSRDDFTEQPRVANGASELLVTLFGAAGHHARVTLGVNALPLGSPVELEMMVALLS